MLKYFIGDKIQSLKEESSAIVDIFTSTIDGLKDVNAKANVELEIRKEKIKTLTQESDTLAKIQEDNTKVIDKINKIFE